MNLDAIQHIIVRRSDDCAKLDPEMWCTICGQRLCDVEDGDYLEVLVNVALEHPCRLPAAPEAGPSANQRNASGR